MKILIIQEYSRHKENELYRECLCFERAFKFLGHDVTSWGLGHLNYKEQINFNYYDIIFCLENYGDDWIPDLSNITKPCKILYAIDPHCRGIDPYVKIFKEKGFNHLFSAVYGFCNKHIPYLPNSVDEELFYDKKIERDIDIGFVGNMVTRERQSLIEYSSKKYNLKSYTGIFGDDMVNLLNRFKFSFNKNISIDVNYRNFESIAAGCILITSYSLEAEKLGFKHGKNCLMYKNISEIEDFLKIDDDTIKSIKINGQKMISKHTFKNRAKNIINFVNNN